jgi:enoyl-CoA hydratase/carnithine racemase
VAVPSFEAVLVALDGAVATVTLNQPEKRNPLSAAMIRDLGAALAWCRAEASVRVVVLTGAGDRAFCAGADLGSSFIATSCWRSNRPPSGRPRSTSACGR